MLLLWDRLIPQVKVSLGKYLRTKTLRLSYLKLHIMQPEWHGPARPISAHPGISGPSGKAIFFGPGRPGRLLFLGRGGLGRAAGFGLSCHSVCNYKNNVTVTKNSRTEHPECRCFIFIWQNHKTWNPLDADTQPFGPTQARRNPEGLSGCGRAKSYFLGNTI